MDVLDFSWIFWILNFSGFCTLGDLHRRRDSSREEMRNKGSRIRLKRFAYQVYSRQSAVSASLNGLQMCSALYASAHTTDGVPLGILLHASGEYIAMLVLILSHRHTTCSITNRRAASPRLFSVWVRTPPVPTPGMCERGFPNPSRWYDPQLVQGKFIISSAYCLGACYEHF